MSTPDRPRFVAGSMGPGTKSPTLAQIRYADLRDFYQVQAKGLLDGGVDLFIIETQFDLLGVKAAINACRRAMQEAGRQVPLQVQVTIELTGRMLPGTEISAALAALDPMKPDIIGLNCATGPTEMGEHLRYLSQHARMPVSVLPNAGLPSVVDGKMHYDLGPEEFVEPRPPVHRGVRRPRRRRLLRHHARVHPSARRGRGRGDTAPSATPFTRTASRRSTRFTPFHQEGATAATSFMIIGERTNANGSKKFREAMLDGDWDTAIVQMAKDQVKEGAHVLDVCVDYVGRDGTVDMDEVGVTLRHPVVGRRSSWTPPSRRSWRPASSGSAAGPSSTRPTSRTASTRARGSTACSSLAREYGSAVICLLIDEEGQARDLEWKMRVAHRIHDIAINRYGLESGDLIFDALTFPLSTGDDDLRRDGIATIEAIRRIKAELPGVYTTLGVSNVSFGLSPAARHVLNSVFLHECVEAGLDSAIVHAAKIMPLSTASPTSSATCRTGPGVGPPRHRGRAVRRRRELRPAGQAARRVRRRAGRRAGQGGPLRLAGRGAPQRPHHRRRPRRPHRRPRRGARRRHPRARHRQRRPAVGHEGGRRPVRPRRDAAPVRAPVGRDDEDGGGLPRAAHGEGRGRLVARAASCSPRSRATCTTSARTSSTSSSPTTATRCTTSASRSRSPR